MRLHVRGTQHCPPTSMLGSFLLHLCPVPTLITYRPRVCCRIFWMCSAVLGDLFSPRSLAGLSDLVESSASVGSLCSHPYSFLILLRHFLFYEIG